MADALHEVAPTSHEMETNSKNIPQPIIKSSEELGHTVAVMASTVASVVTAPEDDHTSIVRAEAVETTLKSDGPDSDLKDCIFPFRIKREAYLKAMEWNRQLMDLQAVLISTEQRVRIDGRVQRENSGRSASRSLLVDQAANYGDRDLHSRQEEHTAEEELTPLMAAINTKDLGRVFQVVTESFLLWQILWKGVPLELLWVMTQVLLQVMQTQRKRELWWKKKINIFVKFSMSPTSMEIAH